jgi:hypothetical protein
VGVLLLLLYLFNLKNPSADDDDIMAAVVAQTFFAKGSSTQ